MKDKQRGFAIIALDNPKFDVNVGSALRAAGIYGAAMVVASGRRFKSQITDTMKAYRHLPFLRVDNVMDCIPYDCVPVAVDLVPGATSLVDYEHPERAFYVFGQEDGTLGERVLSRCRDTVFVPTTGCMNLAATVNVVLYDRMAKQLRGKPRNNEHKCPDVVATLSDGGLLVADNPYFGEGECRVIRPDEAEDIRREALYWLNMSNNADDVTEGESQ